MSQEVQTGLKQKTQQLMDGPLKHIRGAALAAALLPLASIAAAPASAQTTAPCASAGTCGIVFNDTNGNGILDAGEAPIQGVTVTLCVLCNGSSTDTVLTTTTDLNGVFEFPPDGLPQTVTVYTTIPTGTQPSPIGPDNAGTSNGAGLSVATVPLATNPVSFGFVPTLVAQPGTGTPGYWKNHPEAWPNIPLVVGGVTYTKAQALAWLGKTGKDKTVTMFQSLLAAMLSVGIGNDSSCISAAITLGNNWLTTYPLGSNVAGGSAAWTIGDPIHNTLDAYDNGLLCAPHRQ
jgi:SdrD B-like domain